MDKLSLSQSLLALSDAIEQLALIMAEQNIDDKQAQSKHLAVLVNKFTKTTKQLYNNENNHINLQIKLKHKKKWLEKYLFNKNITPGNYINTLQVDKKLFETANFLADHYIELQDFYKQLKYHQNIKKDFVIKTSSKAHKYIVKWAKMLYSNKLIDAFKMLDNGKIDVDIAQIHKATSFINGLWLEIYLRSELAAYLRQNIDKINSFDIMAQVKLQFPGNLNAELDLLIMLNQKVYWFEAKSGIIGSKYYNRFNQIRKNLKLNKTQSFLLVPVFQHHQKNYVTQKTGMELLFSNILPMQLNKYIKL